MNRKEAFERIQNKSWIYKNVNENESTVLVYFGESGEGYGFLVIRFEEDGSITIPSRLGFQPGEFSKWDFDESTQEIVFENADGSEALRGKLPENLPVSTEGINLLGRNARFEYNPRLDDSEVSERYVDWDKVVFLPYTAVESTFGWLIRRGFTIQVIHETETLQGKLNEVYNDIASHPRLKQVVISDFGFKEVRMPRTDKIGVSFDESGKINFNYFAGERSVMMEFLGVVLIEINNFCIKNPGQIVPGIEILNDVLLNKFNERYDNV